MKQSTLMVPYGYRMMRIIILVLPLLCFGHLSYCVGASSGVGRSGRSFTAHSHRVVAPFVNVPTNVFAPQGRLYNVEDAVHTITSSDDNDVSSTSCIVLTCSNGSVIAISSLPQSPYMITKSAIDDSDIDECISNDTHGTSSSTSSLSSMVDTSLCLRHCITTNSQSSDLEDVSVVPPYGRIHWPQQTPTISVTTERSNDNSNNVGDTSFVLSKTSIYNTTSRPNGIVALSLTAGNAVESQILRHRIHQNMDRIFEEKGISTASIGMTITPMLARMMADQNQQRTQISSSSMGRIVAASAILIEFHTPSSVMSGTSINSTHVNVTTAANDNDNDDHSSSSTIYQIDPSGQYWICQAVVSGRFASRIEQQLQTRLLERCKSDSTLSIHNKNRHQMTVTRRQVCDVLSQLSIDDALTIATQCLLNGITQRKGSTNEDHRSSRSRIRLRGIVLSSTDSHHVSIQTFSHHGLLSRLPAHS